MTGLERLTGERRIFYSAAKQVADFMEQQGWFRVLPSAAVRQMDIGDGKIVEGITVGVFSGEDERTYPWVMSEAVGYRGRDGFIHVQMHRAVYLPQEDATANRIEEDSLLSVRLTYTPQSRSLPVEFWQSTGAVLVHTFPSRSQFRDAVRVLYNPKTHYGVAQIQRFGRRIYEHGFSYVWSGTSSSVTKQGIWLNRQPPVPKDRVYGYVTADSAFRLMDALGDEHLFGNATQEEIFQKEVADILNPKLKKYE